MPGGCEIHVIGMLDKYSTLVAGQASTSIWADCAFYFPHVFLLARFLFRHREKSRRKIQHYLCKGIAHQYVMHDVLYNTFFEIMIT